MQIFEEPFVQHRLKRWATFGDVISLWIDGSPGLSDT
jgi:hypothetical protein